MTASTAKQALRRTCDGILKHHLLQASAALSYYFVLLVFPALILLSAIMGFIPFPDLFARGIAVIGRVVPADSMRMVYSVIGDILSAHREAWLSFGTLGTIWVASSAFDATIEALDIAYDVVDDRPLWKTRLLAVGLAVIIGVLALAALGVTVLGPRFGDWLITQYPISAQFARFWPVLRWAIILTFSVLGVEVIYFLAPNVKQRIVATLPGAVLSVLVWNALSLLLGIYFRHFAHYNRTYGTLGGFIAFMTWLYWSSFVLLAGAQLNAELAKESKKGRIQSRAESDPAGDTHADSDSIDRAA